MSNKWSRCSYCYGKTLYCHEEVEVVKDMIKGLSCEPPPLIIWKKKCDKCVDREHIHHEHPIVYGVM